MRIISKTHDYYDSVQSLGQDRELIFLRNEVEEDYHDKKYPFPRMKGEGIRGDGPGKTFSFNVDNYMVGFCGRIYPALELAKHFYGAPNAIKKMCFNLEDVDEFVHANYREKNVNDYHVRKGRGGIGRLKWPYYQRRQNFEEFFQEVEKKKDSFKKLFEEHDCPVFLAKCSTDWYRPGGTIIWNGCLDEVEFFRVKDAYTAFQEISMYLGNLAIPRKTIPKIDDETMAEAKGFDRKFSFRKDKSKKR